METEKPTCCSPLGKNPVSADEAETLARLLKVLAHPVRLRIVSLISSSPTAEICACELPVLVDKSQPTVSHHLKLLTDAGVLEREQRGKWAWFRLVPGQLDEVAKALTPTSNAIDPAAAAMT